jgi:hypothetical protein
LLNGDHTFEWRNYSVPKDDPVHTNGTDQQLRDAIKQHMAPASCVLILAGVYSTYSKWINKEIDLAKHAFAQPKSIIAINPWGQQYLSTAVTNAADTIVKWQTKSIIDAIKKYS